MIIDNVGLYRLFGLPTAHRDWQAMFEGRLAGKGYPEANTRAVSYMALSQGTDKDKTAETDGQLETIVSHGQLLELPAKWQIFAGERFATTRKTETVQGQGKRPVRFEARQ